MRVVMFYHSLISDWNHGNAHFLRGVVTELIARGHSVKVYEPHDSWSVKNLIAAHGREALQDFFNTFPHLSSISYDVNAIDLDEALDRTDLVIVHEWNEPSLIERIGRYRQTSRTFKLVFHDTHHRVVSHDRLPFSLDDYDGVLAYGEVIATTYLTRGWTQNAWTWHEAADVRVFRPLPHVSKEQDLVWIGNWGDEERSEELQEFLIKPVKDLRLKAEAYGVRYPTDARAALESAGIAYRGWLPNYKAPEVFARSAVTLHIPRRPYVNSLPGIPTIRPFEALACGIPLVCSPWRDTEGLFRVGKDYLIANDREEMKKCVAAVLHDKDLARELSINGLETILKRHTCAHRVNELLTIYNDIAPSLEPALAVL